MLRERAEMAGSPRGVGSQESLHNGWSSPPGALGAKVPSAQVSVLLSSVDSVLGPGPPEDTKCCHHGIPKVSKQGTVSRSQS